MSIKMHTIVSRLHPAIQKSKREGTGTENIDEGNDLEESTDDTHIVGTSPNRNVLQLRNTGDSNKISRSGRHSGDKPRYTKIDGLVQRELYLLYQRKRVMINWMAAASLLIFFILRPMLLDYLQVGPSQLIYAIGQYAINEAGLFNLPEDIPNPEILISAAPSNSSCALLFFGLARNNFPEIVLPSIQRNILQRNPQCDVFVHNYKLSTTYTNPRNGELNVALSPDVVRLLTPNQIAYDTDEQFYAARNVTYFRQFIPPVMESNIYFKWSPHSIDNMIRQWHSIQRVFQLMEGEKEDKKRRYDRVGLFRTDVKYRTPIDILEGGEAVIPHFFCKDRFHVTNDRLFYGSYDNAKVWATYRFDFVESFIQKTTRNPPPYPPGGFRGLHSETFMYELLSTYIGLGKVHKADVCFDRVRSSGQVLKDCVVPLKYRSNNTKDEQS